MEANWFYSNEYRIFWIIASILIVSNGMLQISLIQCIGYSFSLILVVMVQFSTSQNDLRHKLYKTWFSMWSLVMIAPLFLLGAVTILDVIYPTKCSHSPKSKVIY